MAGPCALAPAMQTGPRATPNAVSAWHCHPGPGCCLHVGSVRQPWTEKTRPLGRRAEPATWSLPASRGEGRCHCPGGETGRTPRPAPAASAGRPLLPAWLCLSTPGRAMGCPSPGGRGQLLLSANPVGHRAIYLAVRPPARPPLPPHRLHFRKSRTLHPHLPLPLHPCFPILSGWGGGPSATPGVGLRRQVTYTPFAVLPWYQGREPREELALPAMQGPDSSLFPQPCRSSFCGKLPSKMAWSPGPSSPAPCPFLFLFTRWRGVLRGPRRALPRASSSLLCSSPFPSWTRPSLTPPRTTL